MAYVLLLYYHLIDEGGITNDQTVYIDSKEFNPFDFIDFEIREDEGTSLDLDEELIRKGALIHLICDLNDVIGEFDEDYKDQIFTNKIIGALKKCEDGPIEEVAKLIMLLDVPESELDYPKYHELLESIFEVHVKGFMHRKLARKP